MKIKVEIKEQNGNVTNSSLFDSQEAVDQWISENESTSGAWPDPHTVVKTDITTDWEQEQADESAIARGIEKQNAGARAIAMLNQVHEEMNMDAAGLSALAADQNLMLAVTLVRNGALKTGRDIFTAAGTAHYSADQIARIVKPINDSGLV